MKGKVYQGKWCQSESRKCRERGLSHPGWVLVVLDVLLALTCGGPAGSGARSPQQTLGAAPACSEAHPRHSLGRLARNPYSHSVTPSQSPTAPKPSGCPSIWGTTWGSAGDKQGSGQSSNCPAQEIIRMADKPLYQLRYYCF